MELDEKERARLRRLWAHEEQLGVAPIAGVDEAGLGALAGPVAAAAVVLASPELAELRGLNDSKQLSPEQRDALAIEVKAHAVAWAVGWADVDEIRRLGIDVAGLLAMRRAIDGLAVRPAAVLVDGVRRIHPLPMPQRLLVKGDALSLSIAAASVLAKTARDARMGELARAFPLYRFEEHQGYDTPVHRAALEAHGPCAHHRRFSTVVAVSPDAPKQRGLFGEG